MESVIMTQVLNDFANLINSHPDDVKIDHILMVRTNKFRDIITLILKILSSFSVTQPLSLFYMSIFSSLNTRGLIK